MANVNVPASQVAPTPEMGLCRARSQSRQPLPTSTNVFQSALRNNKLERGKKEMLATTVRIWFLSKLMRKSLRSSVDKWTISRRNSRETYELFLFFFPTFFFLTHTFSAFRKEHWYSLGNHKIIILLIWTAISKKA